MSTLSRQRGSPSIRKIEFRDDLPLGLLIGSNGKNVKEISEATGTKVHVEAKSKPYHFVIKAYPGNSTSIEEKLRKSEEQVRSLIERITERKKRDDFLIEAMGTISEMMSEKLKNWQK